MGTFPGLKWPGREVDHSPPPSAEVAPSTGLHAVYRKNFTSKKTFLRNAAEFIPDYTASYSSRQHHRLNSWPHRRDCFICYKLHESPKLNLLQLMFTPVHWYLTCNGHWFQLCLSVCLSVRNNSVIFTRHTSAHITSKRIQLTSNMLHFRLFEVISGLIYMPAETASPQDKARLTYIM